MRTLFLDLASHDGCIACTVDDAVVSSREIHPKTSDRELIEFYESILKEAEWKPANIDRIACVVGPGGFTSLRVAAAFANALSYALDVPSAGIHTSDLKHAQSADDDVLWFHSTKKNELFIRGFGRHAQPLPEPQCISLDTIGQYATAKDRWIGELIPEHRAAVDQLGLIEAASQSLSDVLPSFVAAQTYERTRIDPWYGRGW